MAREPGYAIPKSAAPDEPLEAEPAPSRWASFRADAIALLQLFAAAGALTLMAIGAAALVGALAAIAASTFVICYDALT